MWVVRAQRAAVVTRWRFWHETYRHERKKDFKKVFFSFEPRTRRERDALCDEFYQWLEHSTLEGVSKLLFSFLVIFLFFLSTICQSRMSDLVFFRSCTFGRNPLKQTAQCRLLGFLQIVTKYKLFSCRVKIFVGLI